MSDNSRPTHVAMAGLHGCMPSVCEPCDSYDGAVEVLCQVHELGRRRRAILKRDGYLELSIQRDGNEYCEIVDAEPDIDYSE